MGDAQFRAGAYAKQGSSIKHLENFYKSLSGILKIGDPSALIPCRELVGVRAPSQLPLERGRGMLQANAWFIALLMHRDGHPLTHTYRYGYRYIYKAYWPNWHLCSSKWYQSGEYI